MFRYCKGLLASWNATRIACRQHSEYLVRGVTAGAAEWHSPRPQSHTVTDDILDNPHTLHGHRHRHNHSHNRSHIHRHMHTLYRQMDYRAAEMSMLVPLLSQFQTPQTQSKTELCQKRHAHNLSLTTFRDDGRPLTKRLTLRTCQHLSQFCHKRGNSHSRPFSSSSGHDDDSSHNYKTTGLILQIPSPIKWLRNYFYMYLLKNKLGSKFNLHEFQLGARQAICYLTGLLASGDYEAMSAIASRKAVGQLQAATNSWTSEQQQMIGVTADQINVLQSNFAGLSKLGDSYIVDIDVMFVALKNCSSGPMFIQMTLQFTREFCASDADDWTIAGVSQVKVNKFLVKSDE